MTEDVNASAENEALNEETRRILRGRIRRCFAWIFGGTLLFLTLFVFIAPLFSSALATHMKDLSAVVTGVYWGASMTFLGLAGVDGAVDALSKRRK